MAFDGVLKFGTAIDQTGFKSGLSGLGNLASSGMAAITGAVSAAAGAVKSLGEQAAAVGAGFESSMAQVAATMGITKDTVQDGVNSFDLLSQAAEAAGANTTFSASEAAGALNYLALAGYDAATAADALPAVLDLAAAGALDLQYASDLATDAMAALGIEANKENLTAFGDQMAKTASKANTSVAQLGEAILTVGGTAQMMAGGTEELNASLGVLANRGIKGAEGGTHLRNMLLSLSSPTGTAKETLAALGVSALDASGNMRPLNETFEDLKKAMQGMNDGEISDVLSNIFNRTDTASVQAMLAGCGEEFDDLKAAISDCDGAMSQMAVTMNDTLEGDMKSLGSKAEALGIAVYEGMNSPLRDLAQTGGKYLSILTNAFQKGGLEGAAGMLGNLLSQAADKLSGYLPELADLGARVLRSMTAGMTRNLPKLLETGREVIEILLGSLSETLPQSVSAGAQILGMIGGALLDNLPILLDTAWEIMQEFLGALSNPEIYTKLMDAGAMLLTMLADAINQDLDPILATVGAIITALGTALLDPEKLSAIIEAGGKLLIALIDGLTGDGMAQLLDAVLMLNETLLKLLLDPKFISQLGETGAALLTALIKGLCTLGGTVLGELALLMDSIINVFLETDWVGLGKALIDGVIEGVKSVDFTAFWEQWTSGVIGDIKALFGIASPSKLMRDQIGKNLALGIGEGFTDELPDVGHDAVEAFGALRHSVDPGAVQAFREQAPVLAAQRFAVPAAASYITNNYSYSNQAAAPESSENSGGGDIIIPVTIGGQQLDTIVIKAAQIANARSGGVTI